MNILFAEDINYSYNDILAKFIIAKKTFKNLTASSLIKLIYKDKWFSYLRYMLNSLTLRRESGKQTGIDIKTAFRLWRHHFLTSTETRQHKFTK